MVHRSLCLLFCFWLWWIDKFWFLLFFLLVVIVYLENILISIALLGIPLILMLLTHSYLFELILEVVKLSHVLVSLWLSRYWGLCLFCGYICWLICISLSLRILSVYLLDHILFHWPKHRCDLPIATLLFLICMIFSRPLHNNWLSVLVVPCLIIFLKISIITLPYSHSLVNLWYIWRRVFLWIFLFWCENTFVANVPTD